MRKVTSSYYKREQRKGRKISAMVHVVFFVIAFFGLPDFMFRKPPEELIITVELLPITGVTNIKPMEKPPAPEPKPEEKKSEAKPSPPVKTSEPKPPEPIPEPKKTEVPKDKPVIKKPEPKKEEKPKKPKEDDLAAVLRAVKETAQKEEKKAPEDKKDTSTEVAPKNNSTTYDPSLPMSLNEKDAIMSQLAKCWVPPIGAKDAQNLAPLILAEYNMDGTLLKAEIAPDTMARYNSDSFFRAATDAAMRAVQQCNVLQGLPADKYQTWRMMELNFDPKEMLN